ncbi:hypothetical protein [[Clostridium] symbiosum]|uniref:hypothetical protein n=1 Tax=Clostridium symbiosum TaxID=1512 RepID=UPI0018A0BAC7|nr:hypothetical protein [[Clostridium] symbiosum]
MKLRTRIKFNSNALNQKLITLWIVSFFLDAYAITYIDTYSVTCFSIVSAIVLVKGVVESIIKRKIFFDLSHRLALCMMFYIFLNYIFTGALNIPSMLLAEFFFAIFLFSKREETRFELEAHIELFSMIMNAMAIYGIYQFFGRIFSLPFCDLIIEGHMVPGFNWSNSIYSFGIIVERSNAIFREPSFFSQFLAMNILIYTNKLLKEDIKLKYFLLAVLNLSAMILSFSGTGFIILFFGLVIYLYVIQKNIMIRNRIIILSIPLIAVTIYLAASPIGEYFFKRLAEITTAASSSIATSGYKRFVSGFQVMAAAWSRDFLLGTGIGVGDEFMLTLPNVYNTAIGNGFYKVSIELGTIGISLWLLFIASFWKKKKMSDSEKVILCSIIPLMICHETFMSNYYWFFIYLLNYRLAKENDCDKQI